jgi:hypothetical protein
MFIYPEHKHKGTPGAMGCFPKSLKSDTPPHRASMTAPGFHGYSFLSTVSAREQFNLESNPKSLAAKEMDASLSAHACDCRAN